jgi:hypothetical protein
MQGDRKGRGADPAVIDRATVGVAVGHVQLFPEQPHGGLAPVGRPDDVVHRLGGTDRRGEGDAI